MRCKRTLTIENAPILKCVKIVHFLDDVSKGQIIPTWSQKILQA